MTPAKTRTRRIAYVVAVGVVAAGLMWASSDRPDVPDTVWLRARGPTAYDNPGDGRTVTWVCEADEDGPTLVGVAHEPSAFERLRAWAAQKVDATAPTLGLREYAATGRERRDALGASYEFAACAWGERLRRARARTNRLTSLALAAEAARALGPGYDPHHPEPYQSRNRLR